MASKYKFSFNGFMPSLLSKKILKLTDSLENFFFLEEINHCISLK